MIVGVYRPQVLPGTKEKIDVHTETEIISKQIVKNFKWHSYASFQYINIMVIR